MKATIKPLSTNSNKQLLTRLQELAAQRRKERLIKQTVWISIIAVPIITLILLTLCNTWK